MKLRKLVLAFVSLLLPAAAWADINVGVVLSLTGPAASLGIPEKQALSLVPKTVAGEKINFIILDDATDPSAAVRNTRKLITEEKVDILIGSSTTPAALAMIDPAYEARTPTISLAASSRVVSPMDDKRHWVFKTIQNESLMADLTVDHMTKNGVRKLGVIVVSDGYGDAWLDVMRKETRAAGIEITSVERYARSDSSVTAQILKLVSTNPDAIFIASAGTPASLPQKSLGERRYDGLVYQTYGAANNDFLRVSGKDAEGVYFAVAPIVVAEQLPSEHPVKQRAMGFIADYEKAFGDGSMNIFASNAYDAWLLLENAIPKALKTAKPGTPAFRKALRDAIEGTKNLVSTQGVFNMTPTDHVGYDQRAAVMVEVENGTWKLAQ